MIKIENTDVVGFEAAIRGMRNPMNSWDQSDSWFEHAYADGYSYLHSILNEEKTLIADSPVGDGLGPKDYDLAMKLCKAGSSDAKFRRFIICYADITGPLYWLKEMDTYRMGVEKNSCSTMHKITSKEFTLDDFSWENINERQSKKVFGSIVDELNRIRNEYSELKKEIGKSGYDPNNPKTLRSFWYHLIQLLPSSYNQRRTYMFSYEALSKIYRERRNHKLDEWHQFCDWIELLPYSELITLKGENKNDAE